MDQRPNDDRTLASPPSETCKRNKGWGGGKEEEATLQSKSTSALAFEEVGKAASKLASLTISAHFELVTPSLSLVLAPRL